MEFHRCCCGNIDRSLSGSERGEKKGDWHGLLLCMEKCLLMKRMPDSIKNCVGVEFLRRWVPFGILYGLRAHLKSLKREKGGNDKNGDEESVRVVICTNRKENWDTTAVCRARSRVRWIMEDLIPVDHGQSPGWLIWRDPGSQGSLGGPSHYKNVHKRCLARSRLTTVARREGFARSRAAMPSAH